MPVSVPVPDKASGDIFSEAMWDSYIRDNINKLLDRGHRVLTVAQFAALTGLEDGDEAYVEVDATNGVMWHFRYVAAETTYKWRFLGGPALWSEVTTAESTTSTSYVALTTAGPSITLPRSGDYEVTVESSVNNTNALGYQSYDIGATSAVDDDSARSGGTDQNITHNVQRRRKTGLGAVALVSRYRTTASSSQFERRHLYLTPVRIRHDA